MSGKLVYIFCVLLTAELFAGEFLYRSRYKVRPTKSLPVWLSAQAELGTFNQRGRHPLFLLRERYRYDIDDDLRIQFYYPYASLTTDENWLASETGEQLHFSFFVNPTVKLRKWLRVQTRHRVEMARHRRGAGVHNRVITYDRLIATIFRRFSIGIHYYRLRFHQLSGHLPKPNVHRARAEVAIGIHQKLSTALRAISHTRVVWGDFNHFWKEPVTRQLGRLDIRTNMLPRLRAIYFQNEIVLKNVSGELVENRLIPIGIQAAFDDRTDLKFHMIIRSRKLAGAWDSDQILWMDWVVPL